MQTQIFLLFHEQKNRKPYNLSLSGYRNADYTPSDSLSTAATESQELFTNGKIAMQLNWSHQYPAAVEALGADKVGCAPMIAGSAGVGATTGPWYECVMKDSKNKETDFLSLTPVLHHHLQQVQPSLVLT